jgi:site-specific DNA-cytosine methylase
MIFCSQVFRANPSVYAGLGYYTDYRILNALDFGVPQKRERIFIVGFRNPVDFLWPEGGVPMKPLAEILADEVPDFYYASEKIRTNRIKKRKGKQQYSFKSEFPQANTIVDFLEEREYLSIPVDNLWVTEIDART